MKKLILDALKLKFVGVSDDVLDRVANKLAKTATSEEDVTNLVEGVTFQQILESYGDSRATEAQQTAVANYEKKYGLKDGKVLETKKVEEPKKVETGDISALITAALSEHLKPLQDRIEAMSNEKIATLRKSKVSEIIKGLPESIRPIYEKNFEVMKFENDEAFDAYCTEIGTSVESISNELNTKGGLVTRPKGGGGGSSASDNQHLKARIAEREAAKTIPAVIGLSEN